jgi:hypothetical protein
MSIQILKTESGLWGCNITPEWAFFAPTATQVVQFLSSAKAKGLI